MRVIKEYVGFLPPKTLLLRSCAGTLSPTLAGC